MTVGPGSTAQATVEARWGTRGLIDTLAPEWGTLYPGTTDEPFYRPEWVSAYLCAFAPDAHLLVVKARTEGRLRLSCRWSILSAGGPGSGSARSEEPQTSTRADSTSFVKKDAPGRRPSPVSGLPSARSQGGSSSRSRACRKAAPPRRCWRRLPMTGTPRAPGGVSGNQQKSVPERRPPPGRGPRHACL